MKIVVLAGLEDRQMEVGEDFTASIFICCCCASLRKCLARFSLIWALITASQVQVTLLKALGHGPRSQSSGAALTEELLGPLLGLWQGGVNSGSEPKDSSYTGFGYCHGGLVKSHLDKPTSFFGLQLQLWGVPVLVFRRWFGAGSQLKRSELPSEYDCLHSGWSLASNSAGWEGHENKWWDCLLPCGCPSPIRSFLCHSLHEALWDTLCLLLCTMIGALIVTTEHFPVQL